jgi:hypothetical protein
MEVNRNVLDTASHLHVDAFSLALNTGQIMQDLTSMAEADRLRHIELLESRLKPARNLFEEELAAARESYRLHRGDGLTSELGALRKVTHITKSVTEFDDFLKLLEGFPRPAPPPKTWVYTSRKRRSVESQSTAQSRRVKRGYSPAEPLKAISRVDATITDYCGARRPIADVKTAEQFCRQEWNLLALVLKARLQESLDKLTHQEHLRWLPGQPAPIVDKLRTMVGNTMIRKPQPENLDRRYEEVMHDVDHLLRAQVLAENWYHRGCYLYCNGEDKCIPTCWDTRAWMITTIPDRKVKRGLIGFSDVLNISNAAQPPYNVDPRSVKSFSWDSYMESGVADFATRSLGSAVLTSAQKGLRAVPLMVVCKSPITKSMSEREDFPCVCGDDYGSQTVEIWNRIGLENKINRNTNRRMAQHTCYSRMREADWIRTRGPQFIANMCRINNHLTTSRRSESSQDKFFWFCGEVLHKVDVDPDFRKSTQVVQRAAVCDIWRRWDLNPKPLPWVWLMGPLSLLHSKPDIAPHQISSAMDECICSTKTVWPEACKNAKPEEWADSGYLPLVKIPDSPHSKFMKVVTTWDPNPEMVPLPEGTKYDKNDRPIIKSPWVYEGKGWGL